MTPQCEHPTQEDKLCTFPKFGLNVDLSSNVDSIIKYVDDV